MAHLILLIARTFFEEFNKCKRLRLKIHKVFLITIVTCHCDFHFLLVLGGVTCYIS